MIIEYLYPEVGNLFGDSFNFRLLKACFPEAESIETHLKDIPAFSVSDVDLIYMGSSTESGQELIISALLPYYGRLKELIEKDKIVLCTGNALEIFLQSIKNEDGSEIKGLGLFDFIAKREMLNRYNSLFLGEMEDFEVVGFKSQFSHCYGDNENTFCMKAIKGCGINPASRLEGIRYHNLIGTYLLGPFLLLNPPFVRYLLKLLGYPEKQPPFENEASEAYRIRLEEFHRPDIKMES